MAKLTSLCLATLFTCGNWFSHLTIFLITHKNSLTHIHGVINSKEEDVISDSADTGSAHVLDAIPYTDNRPDLTKRKRKTKAIAVRTMIASLS